MDYKSEQNDILILIIDRALRYNKQFQKQTRINYISIINWIQMSNKNNQGIDSYLNTQKLFTKDKTMYTKTPTSSGFNNNSAHKKIQSIISSKGNTNTVYKNYQYRLLDKYRQEAELDQYVTPFKNEAQKQKDIQLSTNANKKVQNKPKNNRQDMLSKYERQMGQNQPETHKQQQEEHAQKQKQKQMGREEESNVLRTSNLSVNKQQNEAQQKKQIEIRQSMRYKTVNPYRSSNSQNRKKQENVYSNLQQIARQHQASVSWESIVLNSSKRYFDSCRGQALEFIKKMQNILMKQRIYLKNEMELFKQKVQQEQSLIIQCLKQHLYRLVDQSLQQFHVEHLPNIVYQHLQPNIGQLNQLNTQVEQRYKQISTYKHDIDNDIQWRIRASDLLTSNYQQNIVELSKLCKRSVQDIEAKIKEVSLIMEKEIVDKCGHRQFKKEFGNRINKMLLQQVFESQYRQMERRKKQQEEANKPQQPDNKQQMDFIKIRINKRKYELKSNYSPLPPYRNTLLTNILKNQRYSYLNSDLDICQHCNKLINYMPNSRTHSEYTGCDCYVSNNSFGNVAESRIVNSRNYANNQQQVQPEKIKKSSMIKSELQRSGVNKNNSRYLNSRPSNSPNTKIITVGKSTI